MEDTTLQTGILGQSPKRSKFLIFFIVSIFIIVVIFVGLRLFGSKTKESPTPTATLTPTKYQLSKETPTPEATQTAKPTNVISPTSTQKPKPTSNPVDKSTGLDRSKLAVEVQNGSGVVGAAKKAADALKSLGYVISSTGNAVNYDYTNVTIQVKSSKNNFLSLLQKDLSSDYTIGTASADLTATSSADALVIVGK